MTAAGAVIRSANREFVVQHAELHMVADDVHTGEEVSRSGVPNAVEFPPVAAMNQARGGVLCRTMSRSP